MSTYDRGELVTLMWSEGSPNTDDRRECSLGEAVQIVVEEFDGLPKQLSCIILRTREPIRQLDEMKTIYRSFRVALPVITRSDLMQTTHRRLRCDFVP